MRVAGTYTAAPDPVVVAAAATGPTGVPRSGSAASSGKSRTSGRTKHPRIEAWKQALLEHVWIRECWGGEGNLPVYPTASLLGPRDGGASRSARRR
jgi:hypothetical protein